MKIQKLQKELGDSRQDIADQEYERLVSDQEAMLDKLYSEYESLINQKTKNRDKLLGEANTIAQATQDTIKDTIAEYESKYNYTDYLGTVKAGFTTISGNLSPLEDIKKDVFDAVQSEGAIGKIPTAIDGLNTTLGGIATTVKAILEAYTKPPTTDNNSGSGNGSNANANSSSDKNNGLVANNVMSALTGLVQKADSATEKSTNASSNATGSVANAINKVAQIISSTSQNKDNTKNKALDYIKGSAGKPSKKKSEYSAVNQKIWDLTNGKVLSSFELKKLAEIIGVKYNNATKTGNLYKGLKSLGIKGFKRGGIAQLVKDNGEDGLAMVRNGEGFIAPEHVKPIQDLVQLTPQLSEMLKPVVDLQKLPNIQTLDRNGNVSIDIGNIELPNVTNPKEFASQLVSAVQKDRTVQNTLRELTDIPVNRNYNRLSINKYK